MVKLIFGAILLIFGRVIAWQDAESATETTALILVMIALTGLVLTAFGLDELTKNNKGTKCRNDQPK